MSVPEYVSEFFMNVINRLAWCGTVDDNPFYVNSALLDVGGCFQGLEPVSRPDP